MLCSNVITGQEERFDRIPLKVSDWTTNKQTNKKSML
jgi:hypothetical protein